MQVVCAAQCRRGAVPLVVFPPPSHVLLDAALAVGAACRIELASDFEEVSDVSNLKIPLGNLRETYQTLYSTLCSLTSSSLLAGNRPFVSNRSTDFVLCFAFFFLVLCVRLATKLLRNISHRNRDRPTSRRSHHCSAIHVHSAPGFASRRARSLGGVEPITQAKGTRTIIS
ncbi:uncharacterized protein LY79DRAFT_47734 [Colletotrichum navitas]|uniref:Uncharacterized protein n=1 Tax=Colletotrichum navitas TaxID=681940 RepID=A0AAD8V992_9PEZI|nr:uncharacterized protein LY79DRAFT_47734 [Colletotrichum navitas]KAK1596541.1 hypothetical protein LY79DRAFT_47734 [Colletotrichum navitas]